MSTPETPPADGTGPAGPAGQAQAAPTQGQALASLLLALDRSILRTVVEPVILGPVQTAPVHWDVPRTTRWRCHCVDCSVAAGTGRRSFSWRRERA